MKKKSHREVNLSSPSESDIRDEKGGSSQAAMKTLYKSICTDTIKNVEAEVKKVSQENLVSHFL